MSPPLRDGAPLRAEPLQVGIVGAGHFGRFHAQKSCASPQEALVGVCDLDPGRARSVAAENGCRAFADVTALLAQVEAIIIATPAGSHFALARTALEAGKHVLVEKPIAATIAQAEELAALAAERQLVLQVGHLLRYSAEHRAISEKITRPLYIEATRIAPYKVRGTDVSVILDLMIHDLDLVLSLVDSPITSIEALGAAVSSPTEDIANARVAFANGCVAAITASRVSFKTERKMRVFSQDGYLSADFMARELTFINRRQGLPLPGANGFRRATDRWGHHDTMAAEHRAFVASCRQGAPVLVDAAAGIRALDAALRVGQSITQARERMVQSGLIGSLPDCPAPFGREGAAKGSQGA